MTCLQRLKSFTRLAVGAALGLSLFATVIAPPTTGLAQVEPTSAPSPAVRAAEGEGPRLWVVRDADSTLYLFGTVHVLRPDTGWWTPRLQQAFDSADELWLEFAEVDDSAAVARALQRHGMTPDRPLSSVLEPEILARVDAAARTLGMSGAMVEPMRPWAAAMLITLAGLDKAGFDAKSGVELTVARMARAAGKPIRGFETADQQVGLVAAMSEPAQVRFLESTLEDFDRATQQLDDMVQAWADGDVDALDAVMTAEMRDKNPEAYDRMIVRRNAAWARQIRSLMEGEGTVFIAVGAGHLAGDDSVQALLARQGVTVTEVR